jgi:hypothetical protein
LLLLLASDASVEMEKQKVVKIIQQKKSYRDFNFKLARMNWGMARNEREDRGFKKQTRKVD